MLSKKWDLCKFFKKFIKNIREGERPLLFYYLIFSSKILRFTLEGILLVSASISIILSIRKAGDRCPHGLNIAE